MKEQQALIDRLDMKVHDSIVKLRERRQMGGNTGSALQMQPRESL